MLKLSYLRSAEELRKAAPQWDALWQRSEVSAPFARAEFGAQWLTHFRPDAAFYGLVVEEDETFLAALPLVGRRSSKWTACGGMPSNAWGLCGDLLLDAAADESAVLDLLVEGLNEVPWPLLCLAPVAYEAPRWQALLAAARGRGLDSMAVFSQRVGQVQIDGRWDDYQAQWSGNHRRHIRKAFRRAKQSGNLSLAVYTQPAAQLPTLLRRACEIEDRSWKGAAGTSILRAPTLFDWYLGQAGRMADLGHLQLTFLKQDDRSIAFEYGCRAKGAYYSTKVGYDGAYAALSPGQLLRAMLLEEFFGSGDVRLVDFWGPLTDATAKWATRDYAVGKLLIAPRRFVSRLALAGYAAARPCWRRLRSCLSSSTNVGWDQRACEHRPTIFEASGVGHEGMGRTSPKA
ncbi:MAG: hypothetical protein B7Z73_05140 [Planctomycetia bacterium 21-64-5]|nr:MAG: hypothetical protein B7Z73_05140 [Planctomycetia bacterium 21-64-5]HQU44574.1 GNAT family N-acetyltransferase [Pirellulales bacterium]